MFECSKCNRSIESVDKLDWKTYTISNFKKHLPEIADKWHRELRKATSVEIGNCPHCGTDVGIRINHSKD